jgi:type II secretory pathway pseudopilin PulG
MNLHRLKPHFLALTRTSNTFRTARNQVEQGVGGFTIVEIVAAIGVIGLLGAATILALLQLNGTAAVSRCYMGAEAVAQNQIEPILSQPFPDVGPTPSQLTVGTTTQTGIPIYQDPESGKIVVKTTSTTPLITTITDLSRVIVPNTPATPLYRVDVVVNFKYRNRTNSVTISTLRTTD